MPKASTLVLWSAPITLVAVVFAVSIPWLKELSDPVIWAITTAAAVAVLGWSMFVASRAKRST
jgi:hypothetical protein